LVKHQQGIAAGRPPKPRQDGEYFWHPDAKHGARRIALRVYNSGRCMWLVKYRKDGVGRERTFVIGNAAVLNVSAAEAAATKVVAEAARGKDPQQERQEARLAASLNVRDLCNRYFEAMQDNPTQLKPRTLYNYRSFARNHLGPLATMQADKVTRRDVAVRLNDIAREISPNSAAHFQSMLSSSYKWGLDPARSLVSDNPCAGIDRPEILKEEAVPLTMDELGMIWRACEAMEKSEPRYKGNAWGGGKPVQANSTRADDSLMTLPEAARQSGLHKSILHRAIKDGLLKTKFLRDMPGVPSRRGRGRHRNVYMVSGAELRRFTEGRLGLMRSPEREYSIVVRLQMLLGARYSLIGGLRWSEIERDGDGLLLRIKPFTVDGLPRTGLKAKGVRGKPLLIYLPEIATNLIKKVEKRPGCDLLFGTGRTELTAGAQQAPGLIENARYKEELDAIIKANEGRPILKPYRDPKTRIMGEKPWHLHLLRHTAISHWLSIGEDWRLIASVTGHLSKEAKEVPDMLKPKGAYNHAQYQNPQRNMLEEWAQEISDAARGITRDKSNVVRGAFGK
jgi:integrase